MTFISWRLGREEWSSHRRQSSSHSAVWMVSVIGAAFSSSFPQPPGSRRYKHGVNQWRPRHSGVAMSSSQSDARRSHIKPAFTPPPSHLYPYLTSYQSGSKKNAPSGKGHMPVDIAGNIPELSALQPTLADEYSVSGCRTILPSLVPAVRPVISVRPGYYSFPISRHRRCHIAHYPAAASLSAPINADNRLNTPDVDGSRCTLRHRRPSIEKEQTFEKPIL